MTMDTRTNRSVERRGNGSGLEAGAVETRPNVPSGRMRRGIAAMVLLAALFVVAAARPATAQFGYGYGFGGLSPYAYGYGYGGYFPSFANVGFYNTGFYNTGFYNTPFVNTYFGNTLGYGGAGFGNWGGGWGLGYGGWGLGYGGLGYGYGGLGFGAITPYGGALLRQEQAMLAMGRYNLWNAEATQAYSSAQLYHQQALAAALANYKTAARMTDRYSPTKVQPSSAEAVVDPRAGKIVTREQLISPDGRVLWPASAPKDEKLDPLRAAFEDAAHEVMIQYRDHGRARVQSVAEAKARLLAYAQPALRVARRSEAQKNSRQFWAFLDDLEQILDGMADPDASAKNKTD